MRDFCFNRNSSLVVRSSVHAGAYLVHVTLGDPFIQSFSGHENCLHVSVMFVAAADVTVTQCFPFPRIASAFSQN